MNKAASLAVKSLLGVGSVAGAASGGIVLWNQKSSGKNGEVSESPESNRNEVQGNQKAPEGVVDQENSKVDKEGKADERGSHKTQDELQITGNSVERRKADDKGSLKQQNAADDSDDPVVKARREKEAKKMEQDSKDWKGGFSSYSNEDTLGLPKICNDEDRTKSNSECDLSAENLKKIKFKDLGTEQREVTVTPSGNVNVKLKIVLLRDMSKKYTFVNDSSSDIVISKGAKRVTLKGKANTEFLREGNSLVIEKLENYGIPERCVKDNEFLSSLMTSQQLKSQNAKECSLSAGDLSKIKFYGFSGEGESNVTPLWVNNGINGWEHDHVILLTIEDGKYIFYNHFSDISKNGQLARRTITITKGKVSVTLDGNMKSEFTVKDGALKKEEVTDLGFPKRCEIEDTKQDKTCELSENDIRRLKLKKTGVSPDVSYNPDGGNKEMILKIEKSEDNSTYPDNKKYILSAKGDTSITIYNTTELKDGVGKEGAYWTNSLQFDKGVEKTFKNEGNYLVEVFQ